jgi:hypothetical protein
VRGGARDLRRRCGEGAGGDEEGNFDHSALQTRHET